MVTSMIEITDTILAKASKQVYNKNPLLLGFKTKNVTMGNNKCCIFYNNSDIIVSFAGTDDLDDVIDDLSFFKETIPGRGNIKVHKGFLKAWEELSDEVFDTIYDVFNTFKLDQNIRMYVTGHSLGGALALLFSMYYSHKEDINRVVVFGCPRVGNSNWKSKFNEMNLTVIRYVNNQDVVPKVPTLFYFHVGESIYFDENKNISKTQPFSWKLFIRKIRGAFDHRIDDYIKCLDKNKL